MNLNSNESRENSCNARNELKCPSAIGSQVALVLGMEYENEDLGGGGAGAGGGLTYLKGSNAETGKTTASQSEKIQNIVYLEKLLVFSPANIYLFNVSIKNNRERCKMYSKIIIKILKRARRCSGVFINNSELVSLLFSLLLLLNFNR